MNSASTVTTGALTDRVTDLIARLLEAGDRTSACAPAIVDIIGTPAGRGTGGRSSLNADGSPLQVCLTVRADGWDVRVIGDPACELVEPLMRARAARASVAALLRSTGSTGLAALAGTAWSTLLPDADEELAAYTEGVVWLGQTLDEPGCALYFDVTKPPPAQAWERIERWLDLARSADDAAGGLCRRLARVAAPLSAGFEGIDADRVRKKLYWRLREPAALASFGVDLFTAPDMLRFLNLVVGDRVLDGSGLVFACGLAGAVPRVQDAKIDVCAHCLRQDTAAWSSLFAHLVDEFGLTSFPLDAVLAARLSYVGFGLDRFGNRRLNIYLGAAS
jgi:hypothetical protein